MKRRRARPRSARGDALVRHAQEGHLVLNNVVEDVLVVHVRHLPVLLGNLPEQDARDRRKIPGRECVPIAVAVEERCATANSGTARARFPKDLQTFPRARPASGRVGSDANRARPIYERTIHRGERNCVTAPAGYSASTVLPRATSA